jgi:hypothetical protein
MVRDMRRSFFKAAQPVREPLTDDTIKGFSEDIWGCELDYQHTWEIEFARAIERAHGIGETGGST